MDITLQCFSNDIILKTAAQVEQWFQSEKAASKWNIDGDGSVM